jgi:20S proteasome alpha/beta subunit
MRKNGAPYEEKSAKQLINFNNYLQLKKRKKGFNYYKTFKKDMTYILGARCKDGVVLVGDTKVTVGGGTDFQFGKKIVRPLPNVIMGSAGASGMYKAVQDRIITALIQMERESSERARQENIRPLPAIVTEEEFYTLVNQVIRQMHRDFDEDRYMITYNLMILCASRIGKPEAQITAFTGDGVPEPVNDYMVIGHGEPYGSVFLKKLWKKTMNMEQTAKLGIFILKYIQDMHLDSSVGYNMEYLPQVVYIPDIHLPKSLSMLSPLECSDEEFEDMKIKYQKLEKKYPIRELTKDEVNNLLNQVSSKIADFENYLTSGEFKL